MLLFLTGTPQGLPRTPRDRQGSLFRQLFLQGPNRELPGLRWIPRGRRFVRLFVCLFIAFCIKAQLLLLLALLVLLLLFYDLLADVVVVGGGGVCCLYLYLHLVTESLHPMCCCLMRLLVSSFV